MLANQPVSKLSRPPLKCLQQEGKLTRAEEEVGIFGRFPYDCSENIAFFFGFFYRKQAVLKRPQDRRTDRREGAEELQLKGLFDVEIL